MQKITLLISLFILSTFSSYFLAESSPSRILKEISVENHFIALINSNSSNEGFDVPQRDILSLGIKGFLKLKEEGSMPEGKPLTVIDFSLPSTEKRMWIIDMEDGVILHHGYVSHGRNSGDLMAQKFSNKNSSYMSSLGFYLTAETYHGKHGYSLRLDGLEPGFNDNARERAIVIHGAEYAREDFIKQTGRLGRSLGCPALPQEVTAEIINLIKERSVLFIYGKDYNYLNQSQFLNA